MRRVVTAADITRTPFGRQRKRPLLFARGNSLLMMSLFPDAMRKTPRSLDLGTQNTQYVGKAG